MSFTNFCRVSFIGRGAPRAGQGTAFPRRGYIRALQLCLLLPAVAGAQSAKDSTLYLRAQQMVANGDAAGGRKLADSVANAAPAGTAAYAEGLYWRATLAANARDSEHAYRQIIVDYPLSGRVPDALLRIGQLESARGENAAALQHFQRLVLEHPLSPLHAEASYWVARMYFDANDAPHACAANSDAMANAPASNVELRNRIDFQQQRCRGVTLATNAPAAPAPVKNVPVVNSPKPPVKPAPGVAATSKEAPKNAVPERHDTVARPVEPVVAPSAPTAVRTSPASAAAPTAAVGTTPGSVSAAGSGVVSRPPTKEEVDRALASAAQSKLLMKTPAAPAKATARSAAKSAAKSTNEAPSTSSGRYAVQVAAFRTRAAAAELATGLHGRGYDAYVDGTSAPYRVRIGHYATHAAAAQELEKLKARHIDGFVAER
ncbi:MAG: SPOR domain-containing protein [Gemmatimonadota bacterium]